MIFRDVSKLELIADYVDRIILHSGREWDFKEREGLFKMLGALTEDVEVAMKYREGQRLVVNPGDKIIWN